MTPKFPQGTRLTRAETLIYSLAAATVLIAILTLTGGLR